MKIEIVFLGLSASIMWGFIWRHMCRESPLGWASPGSLFSAGLFFYYIIPPLYWQMREWPYVLPSYFEGLPLVLKNVMILGIPFFVYALFRTIKKGIKFQKIQFPVEKGKSLLWLFAILAIIGIGWRAYLITLGWQARGGQSAVMLFGSEGLGYLASNISYYVPVPCLILILYGDRLQCKAGKFLWIAEGVLRLVIFSRFGIMRYMLLSFLFSVIIGYKFKLRQWIVAGIGIIFTLSFVGASQMLIGDYIPANSKFVAPAKIFNVLKTGTSRYMSNEIVGMHISPESNVLMKSLDDTMYRMYDARSASAVMEKVPDIIPYYCGETLQQVLYAFMPRYFWVEKPNLDSIHRITSLAMWPERGNPLGTLAELYLNYGSFAVFWGGIFALLICLWTDYMFSRKGAGVHPMKLAVYPIIAEQFIYASNNASQRICEYLRGLLVLMLIVMALKVIKSSTRKKPVYGIFKDSNNAEVNEGSIAYEKENFPME